MLRWSFLLLLLVNVLLYGWFYQEQEYRRQVASRVEKQVHGVAALDLLSEVPRSVLRPREPTPRPEPVVPLAAEPEPGWYCYQFGVFTQAQALEAWLGPEGPGDVEIEQQLAEELPSVYSLSISAPQGAKAQSELLGAMRALGLPGQWAEVAGIKRALLLGEYEQQASARALELVLRQQGYAAVVKGQARPRYNYYLLLRTDSDAVIGSAWERSLLKQFPAVKSEKNFAKGLQQPRGLSNICAS